MSSFQKRLSRLPSLLFSVLVLGFSWVNPALAFQLLPMSQTFAPSGAGSTKTYRVVNSKETPIAVEVSVVKREVNLLGEETLTPADEDFVVYPPQMILEPQSSQTVRVTWLGETAPESELSYRFIAEQLPVELNAVDESDAPLSASTTGAVQVLLRYAGSLYIRPDGVQPDLQLKTVELERDEVGKKWLAIDLENQGTARQLLKNFNLEITSNQSSISLTEEQLEPMLNHSVLAQKSRRFLIPWPAELPEGKVSGKLNFQ